MITDVLSAGLPEVRLRKKLPENPLSTQIPVKPLASSRVVTPERDAPATVLKSSLRTRTGRESPTGDTVRGYSLR